MDEQRLAEIFQEHGDVLSVKVIRDFDTQRSRGFGFVEYGDYETVDKVIAALNNKIVDGRKLTVSYGSRDKQSHAPYDGHGPRRVKK